jgi:hypothetical protein
MIQLSRSTAMYQQHIKSLPREERLNLLAMIAYDLAQDTTSNQTERNIMELHGLGKELWQGIDAQEYVNTLRQEWEHRG